MNLEITIPSDEPARLLNGIIEEMNLSPLYETYSDEGRNEYSPRLLLKICVYGYMRKIISSREIERACRENIVFMYLLEGHNPPDHNTIARFRSQHLAAVQDEMQAEITRVLMGMGEISFDASSVFIDGTKIESAGNRYKFVWKKSVQKNYAKLQQKIRDELPAILTCTGIRFYQQLRMNRSIQAEGVFAYVKTDLEFRRFHHRGTSKVGAEWTLLALAYNILRLHHKTESGRLGTHLFELPV